MHYFQCAGQFSEKFPYGRHLTDIDYIFFEGDKIYTFLSKDNFQSVDELPRRRKIYNCNIDINKELENPHEGVTSHGESLSRDIVNVSEVCSQGCLIFIAAHRCNNSKF